MDSPIVRVVKVKRVDPLLTRMYNAIIMLLLVKHCNQETITPYPCLKIVFAQILSISTRLFQAKV